MDSEPEPTDEIKAGIFRLKGYQEQALLDESISIQSNLSQEEVSVPPEEEHRPASNDSESTPSGEVNDQKTEPAQDVPKAKISAPDNSKLIKTFYQAFDKGLNRVFNFLLKNEKEETQDFFQREETDYDYITTETQEYLDYLNIKLDDNPHLRFIIAIGSSYAVPLMLFYFAGGFSEFGNRIRRKKPDE